MATSFTKIISGYAAARIILSEGEVELETKNLSTPVIKIFGYSGCRQVYQFYGSFYLIAGEG